MLSILILVNRSVICNILSVEPLLLQLSEIANGYIKVLGLIQTPQNTDTILSMHLILCGYRKQTSSLLYIIQ